MKKKAEQPINILLVEDNLGDILLIREGLKYSEVAASLSVVRDGEEALQFLRRQEGFSDAVKPDIILLDLNLPKLDGREVLKEIKNDLEFSTIPVVVLTSSEAEKDLTQAYDLAANAYVVKPVSYQSYIEMLQNVTGFWVNTVTLPVPKAFPDAKDIRPVVPAAETGSRDVIHLLIVDDSPGDRTLYRTYLQDDTANTYRFLEAVTGEEGIALCRSLKPDCVLLDHYLPDIDGAEVLEKLIAEHKHLPVVMLTGQGSADLAVKLMKKGAQDYLSKDSMTAETLQKSVCNAIERSSMLRQIEISNQEILQAKEKAETATRAKSDFLANISHELRTPMNAVVGITHLLKISKPLSDKQRELVETLDESAKNLLDLINNLLDLSRTESGSIQLEKTQFNLGELVERCINIMQVKAQEKNLKLTYDISTEAKRPYIGDPLRIQQVLHNLLSNAIKFTATGTVTVNVGIKTRHKRNRVDVELSVKDSGIGITSEQLPLIFRKFTQADASIFRKYGGSGLGLSICKQLVEAMGGEINVESVKGKGSTFTLRLPLMMASTSRKKDEDTQRENTIRYDGMILLVEDYQPNILVATMLLEALGFRYDVALSGTEAIEKIQKNEYDLVLMDVQMDDMDGMEATRRIRTWENTQGRSRIPIIAMTANAFIGAMEECIDAGMDDYISKPFNPDDLQEKIDKYLLTV